MKYSEQEKKILDAALAVISRETISGTRMHLIAEESGRVQSNLHYHFKTKNELLKTLFLYIQESYQDRRMGYSLDTDDTLEGKIHAFFLQKKALLTSDPDYDLTQFDFWVYGHKDDEIRRLFNESYREWHDHIVEMISRYRPGLSRDRISTAAYTMISLTVGAAFQYLNGTEGLALDSYFLFCENMVLAQLGE